MIADHAIISPKHNLKKHMVANAFVRELRTYLRSIWHLYTPNGHDNIGVSLYQLRFL